MSSSRVTGTLLGSFAEPGLGRGAPPKSARWTGQRAIQATAVVGSAACVLYLVWRATSTLAWSVWWLSLPLLALEIHAAVVFALFVFVAWDVDALPPAPVSRAAPGRVAVLVPTYNEPLEVLLPTVSAAVAMRLAHETWVLDDGDRPWVRELAAAVGARYRVRQDRREAKAGNINAALAAIDSDFVVVLDADHVAEPDLLPRTLGYFADPRVALVQTPQDFYNDDSFEHVTRSRWRRRRPDAEAETQEQVYCEQGLFYRVLQPGRNRWNAAFCCGSNVVLRTSALRAVGGFSTASITEDIHTTLVLHRRGYRTVFHNEVLARGLAAADGSQYLSQRLRWGTGAMQVIRSEHPLRGGGLTVPQRLSYAATLTGWFDAWRTLGYLLIPMVVLLTGASPISAPLRTLLLVFVPTFLLQQVAVAALSRGYGSFRRAMLFEFVRMPANLAATLTLFSRSGFEFRVTPKGRLGTRRQRIQVPRLHLVLLVLGVAAAGWFVLTLAGLTPLHYGTQWVADGAAFWLAVNLAVLVAAVRRIRSLRHASERRAAVRFTVANAQARIDGRPVRLRDVSVTGARVTADPATPISGSPSLQVVLGGEAVQLDAVHLRSVPMGEGEVDHMLEFLPGQLQQRAALARQLFLRLTAAEPGLVGELIPPQPTRASVAAQTIPA